MFRLNEHFLLYPCQNTFPVQLARKVPENSTLSFWEPKNEAVLWARLTYQQWNSDFLGLCFIPDRTYLMETPAKNYEQLFWGVDSCSCTSSILPCYLTAQPSSRNMKFLCWDWHGKGFWMFYFYKTTKRIEYGLSIYPRHHTLKVELAAQWKWLL